MKEKWSTQAIKPSSHQATQPQATPARHSLAAGRTSALDAHQSRSGDGRLTKVRGWDWEAA